MNRQSLVVERRWPLPGSALGVAPGPDGAFTVILATGPGGEAWTVRPTQPRAIVQRELGLHPTAWTAEGSMLYLGGVAADGGNEVIAWDRERGAARARLALDWAPTALALAPAQLLLVGRGSGLGIYALPGLRKVGTVRLPAAPRQIISLPYGHKAFALCGDRVAVVDTQSGALLALLRPGNAPQDLLLKPDGGELYVSNLEGTVTAIDTARDEVTATMAAGRGAGALAVAADGTVLYVANASAGTISVLNLDTRRSLGLVRVGLNPSALALAPDGYLFAADAGSDDVAVVRGNQDRNNPDTLVALLPSPPHPRLLWAGRP